MSEVARLGQPSQTQLAILLHLAAAVGAPQITHIGGCDRVQCGSVCRMTANRSRREGQAVGGIPTLASRDDLHGAYRQRNLVESGGIHSLFFVTDVCARFEALDKSIDHDMFYLVYDYALKRLRANRIC